MLCDGKVLVAGAAELTGELPASADLYDAQAGRFTATGSMTVGRNEHTATLLSNGQVLIAGGVGVDGQFLASAELYQ
jgi:hypothetical protein